MNYKVIVSPKTPTKNYKDFCPGILIVGRANILVIFDHARKQSKYHDKYQFHYVPGGQTWAKKLPELLVWIFILS